MQNKFIKGLLILFFCVMSSSASFNVLAAEHSHTADCYNGEQHIHSTTSCYEIQCEDCSNKGYISEKNEVASASPTLSTNGEGLYYYYCRVCSSEVDCVLDTENNNALLSVASCGHSSIGARSQTNNYSNGMVITVRLSTAYGDIIIRERCSTCKNNPILTCTKLEGQYYNASGIVNTSCNKVVTDVVPKK